MIHIELQPEPDDFDNLVRRPGQKYLAKNPQPKTKEFNAHSYWRRILPHLHDSYRGICAYSCHWIPYDTGADTVEHFRPKDLYPSEAYEWDNYRLVCATLNGRKGTREDILDPFQIQNGWFIIDFPSLQVKPAEGLGEAITRSIEMTIELLGLNDRGTCWKSRAKYIESYCRGKVTFEYLQDEAPFIALELERQNLRTAIRDMMEYD